MATKDEDGKFFAVRDLPAETRKKIKRYAADHDISMAEALSAIVDAATNWFETGVDADPHFSAFVLQFIGPNGVQNKIIFMAIMVGLVNIYDAVTKGLTDDPEVQAEILVVQHLIKTGLDRGLVFSPREAPSLPVSPVLSDIARNSLLRKSQRGVGTTKPTELPGKDSQDKES